MPSHEVPWAKVTVDAEAVEKISELAVFAGRLQTELDAVNAENQRLRQHNARLVRELTAYDPAWREEAEPSPEWSR
jgi:hypothetical protein